MNFTDQYIKMCDCEEIRIGAVGEAHLINGENLQSDWGGETTYVPYQHDIQALIFQYGNCQYKLLTDFYAWCTECKDNLKACTMEEMWLQFYMWRDHYKIWDGDKWIKE